MKKLFWIIFSLIILLSSCLSSRLYQPMNDTENVYYININKNIWPDDVRSNIENYAEEFVGWAGIVQQYRIENNAVRFTMTHHYYDWIEDFGYAKGPILLSPDGEGDIIGYYILRQDITEDQLNEFTKDLLGDCIILYGFPNEIMENGEILMDTKYARRISKKNVDPEWRSYGRQGYMGELK